MVEEWTATFAPPSDEEIAQLARSSRTNLSLPYASKGEESPETQADLEEAWRRYVEIYFRMLTLRRLPTPDEVAELERIARRRLHQSVELVDLQRAFRAGARLLLTLALERVAPQDAGAVATATLKFADIMSTAAERAYLDEQRSLAETHRDVAATLALRLLRREISPSDPALEDGPAHRFEFGRPYTLVEIASAVSSGVRRAAQQAAPARLSSSLRGILPFALEVCPAPDTVVLVVPGDSATGLVRLLSDAISAKPEFADIRIGIAAPQVGLRKLVTAHEQATRARALGEILVPAVRVHRWEEMEKIDVFARGDSIVGLVESFVGPLIDHDRRKGTQLTKTLATFLDTGGNRKAAAGKLTIHINTLDYRLRQIRGLLGEDSISPGHFTLHLALRLYPLYESRPEAAAARVGR